MLSMLRSCCFDTLQIAFPRLTAARSGYSVADLTEEGSDSDSDSDDDPSDPYASTFKALERQPKYRFPDDVFSAFLIGLLVGRGTTWSRRVRAIYPFTLAGFCLLIQLVASRTVWMHVDSYMATSLTAPVQNNLFVLAYSDKAMDKDIYEPICGIYEEYDVNPPSPAGTVPLPGGGFLSGVFFFAKGPQWTWNPTRQEAEKSILDKIRYVMAEDFPNPVTGMSNSTGYAMLFSLLIVLWTLAVFADFREIVKLILMLQGVETSWERGAKSILEDDEQQLYIAKVPPYVKVVGVIVSLLRCAIVLHIWRSGVHFLQFTVEKVDLLLNSLALAFLLELPQIIYFGAERPTLQSFMSALKEVTYKSKMHCLVRKINRNAWTLLVLISVFCITYLERREQIRLFRIMLNDVASLCLFGGPSDKADMMMPVPGVCESLMQLTCAQENSSAVGPFDLSYRGGVVPRDYCVVTDFDDMVPLSLTMPPTASMWLSEVYSVSPHLDLLNFSRSINARVKVKFDTGATKITDRMRQVCMSMWSRGHLPRNKVVDGDTNEMGNAAPFECRRDSGLWDYFKHFIPVTLPWVLREDGSFMSVFGEDYKLNSALTRCHKHTLVP